MSRQEGQSAAADEQRLDPQTVEALFEEHAEAIRRFLVGLLRDPALADDVLQATFVKAVDRGHTSRAESRKSWLFRVAYREAMAIRRRQAVGDRVLRQLTWTRSTVGASADEPVLRDERVAAVRRAIGELPPAQRQLVEKRIYEEKTFAAIAQELGIPLGTALGRMRAALKKLHRMLEEPETE